MEDVTLNYRPIWSLELKFIYPLLYNSENKPRGLYFSKTLFEGLIFGGAYVWRETWVSKSIGLACSGKEIYHFCFVLLCIRGQIPSTSPSGRGGGDPKIRRGDLTLGFLRYDFGGEIYD